MLTLTSSWNKQETKPHFSPQLLLEHQLWQVEHDHSQLFETIPKNFRDTWKIYALHLPLVLLPCSSCPAHLAVDSWGQEPVWSNWYKLYLINSSCELEALGKAQHFTFLQNQQKNQQKSSKDTFTSKEIRFYEIKCVDLVVPAWGTGRDRCMS